MIRKTDPTSPAEIGRRLALTRRALGYTTTTMCRMMGSQSGGSAYSNYEIGRRRIALDLALALCAHCRLTLAWIYQGQLDTLPADIRDKILALLPDDGQHTNRKSR
jgi:transcriptional regulator with XRE-family HTH domain